MTGKISILTPISCPVSPTWALRIKNLKIPGEWSWHTVKGFPIDEARNQLVRMALKDSEYMFFLDSDVVPPVDAILVLLSLRLPFVCGLYWSKRQSSKYPGGHWVAWHSLKPDVPLLPDNIPKTSLVEVEAVGMGCCLIHRKVFEKMEKAYGEWFAWTLRGSNAFTEGGKGRSEDIEFSQRVRSLGIPIYVNTRVRCMHIFGSGGAAVSENGQVVQVV